MSTSTNSMLSAAHLRMLRDESGIAHEVIAERGYRSLDDARGYAELKALGFSTTQAKQRPGLLLPLHTTDGRQPLTIYRPDAPPLGKDGNIAKYQLPQGAGARLDCPPRCQPFLENPAVHLWITEGQKKADALASQGAVALALLGVWSFIGKNSFGAPTLLADFDCVAWQGRDVRLVFDSDVTNKASVRKALERLTAHLTNKHANVRRVYLPPIGGKKVGVDDFLVAGHTLQDLEALLDAPRPQPQPAPSHMELLDTAPAYIRRPLALVDGRMYAAVWLYVKLTRTEGLDKAGHIVRFATPEVTTEQRLFIVRDDGVIFGDDGDKPFADLGLEVRLPEIPQQAKLWATPAVKAYREGARPDPAALFRQVVAVVNRFIDFNRSLGSQETMCELVACYILATWFLDAFTVIGYLWPNGERGSGKTQLLTVVAELAYLGHVILAGGSFASLRDLADYGATLCFDDAEKVMDLKHGDPDKRALLLAGNRRGNTIPVKEPVNGRAWRTRHVQTFCPRLFSAIRLPDPVLASRTIIVPLIRTADREKANADPLDYRLWPIPRAQLVNDLWALALSQCATVPRYDAQVADTATLLGRSLEPWRALLAVAHWLTDCGVTALSSRMETLGQAYQQERLELEPANLTALVVHALLQMTGPSVSSVSSVSSVPTESSRRSWTIKTADLTKEAVRLVESSEYDIEPSYVTTRRVGRVLKSLRLTKNPDTSTRAWDVTADEIVRLGISFGLIPNACNAANAGNAGSTRGTVHDGTGFSDETPLCSNGVNGAHGANGAVSVEDGADGHPGAMPSTSADIHMSTEAGGMAVPPCANCGATERWDDHGVPRCVACWPPAAKGA